MLNRTQKPKIGDDRITDPSNPRYEGPICCDCRYCGDKYSFPEPNDLLYTDSSNPLLKHFYCCCGDSAHYKMDITGLDVHKCEHFEEL